MNRRPCASFRLLAVLGLSLAFVLAIGQPMEPEAKLKIADAIFAKFKALADAPAKARQDQVVAFMKTFKEVEHAAVSEDGNMSCIFRDKMAYTILVTTQRTESDPKSSPLLDIFRKPPSPPPAGGPIEAVPDSHLLASLAPLPPAVQGSADDLPVSLDARIANGLGPAFGNAPGLLKRLLESRKYRVAPEMDSTLPHLILPGLNGFFYFHGHGGNGSMYNPETQKMEEQYILTTGQVVTPDTMRQVSQGNLNTAGMVNMCDSSYDQDSAGRLEYRRTFTISKAFIKRFWKFSKNSFVIIDACNSNKLADVMKDPSVNCSVFFGYTGLSNANVGKAVPFLVDRLMGVNDDAVLPQAEGWPQRPFNYPSIDREMRKRGMFPHTWTYEGQPVPVDAKFNPCRDKFGILTPSIRNLSPLAFQKKLEINGIFGEDPGEQNRKVTLSDVAMVVDSWKPDKITIFLPDGLATNGELIVYHQGRPSNPRWLSNWKGTVNLFMNGDDTLALTAEFLVNFLGDPWPYRENAGDIPTQPMIWTLTSAIDSSCKWAAVGDAKDSQGKTVVSWRGGGEPKTWQDELGFARMNTFGVGGVGDSFQKVVNVYLAIRSQFDLIEQGTPTKADVKLGAWLAEQSQFRAKIDSDYNIFGDTLKIEDDPSRLSYGAKNALLKWTPMQCRKGMPKNAAR